MKFSRLASLSLATAGLLAVVVGCGANAPQNETESNVNFVKTSANKALLEDRDFAANASDRSADTFLFGFRVTNTQNFFTGALSLDFRPTAVKLVKRSSTVRDPRTGRSVVKNELAVAGTDGGGVFMTFDMASLAASAADNSKWEVDFGTAGNTVELYEGINQLGASTMARAANVQPWKTAGKPRVLAISQDADSVVADVQHTVSYTRTDDDGKVESRSGQVTVRIYLKRQTASNLVGNQTVGAAKRLNIGFFPSDNKDMRDPSAPIARYDIDVRSRGSKTIYLKDFPADMQQAATEGVTAWNSAFGYEAFKVAIAPAGVDIGDPRYNVMKWKNDLEKDVPWAGYAPSMVDPDTGAVVATQILINGNSLRKDKLEIADYTKRALGGFNGIKGKIGNVPVVEGQGENPVVTFFTDVTVQDSATYVKDYYRSVIMHEFGHSLGLRHNFAASTKVDPGGIASSVMDYEPNFNTNKRKLPGSYDVAAIRYGYFNERPAAANPFCSDEDIDQRIDCNQGDIGDPLNYTVASLVNGVGQLTYSALALPVGVPRIMQGSIKNAFKFLDLISQVPSSRRAETQTSLTKALASVRDARPDSNLDAAGQATSAANLKKLKASYAAVLKERAEAAAARTLGE